MADEGDVAQQLVERQREAAIEAARERSRRAALRPSRSHCLGCGDRIPAQRLAAVPGCRHCVACATAAERRGASWS